MLQVWSFSFCTNGGPRDTFCIFTSKYKVCSTERVIKRHLKPPLPGAGGRLHPHGTKLHDEAPVASGWNCFSRQGLSTSLDGASWWHHGLVSTSATKQVFPKKKNIRLVLVQQPNILNGCQRSEHTIFFFKGIYVRSAIITDASLNHPTVSKVF